MFSFFAILEYYTPQRGKAGEGDFPIAFHGSLLNRPSETSDTPVTYLLPSLRKSDRYEYIPLDSFEL